MRSKVRFLLLGFVELIFIFIIFLLAEKIYKIKGGSVKGIQYINKINKNDLIWDSTSSTSKFFYELKPNFIMNFHPDWLPYEIHNSINQDSLHESKNYLISKPTNTFRIITIGDSFTFGQYVEDHENFSKILESKLNLLKCRDVKTFEVINFGVPGYDISYTEKRFRTRGVKYNPDLVIWLLNQWDFDKLNDLVIPKIEELKKSGVIDFDPISKSYIRMGKAVDEINAQIGKSNIINYEKASLFNFKNYYNEKLLLVTFPNNDKTFKSIIDSFLTTYPDTYFQELFNFWSNDNETFRFVDGHPNKLGHQKIGENLYSFLRDNPLKGICQE